MYFRCDITQKSQIDYVVQETIAQYGHIDILVNNAGIPYVENFFNISENSWKHILDVNITGAFLFTQAVAAHMKKRNYGKIINIASINSRAAVRCNTAYVTSKGAI